MTVKECYESMESDYEGVIGRMGSEGLVKRFALNLQITRVTCQKNFER